MSGILEESDLAHYKPKCDIIIKGHAYPPPNKHTQEHFYASIKLQTPDSIRLAKTKAPSKYLFTQTPQNKQTNDQYIQGQTLINKTLTTLSPRHSPDLNPIEKK